MIDALSRRADFARLRRHGQRVRHDAMILTALPDAELGASRLAFALPRSTGTAVRRNRIRRRLREVLRRRDAAGGLPPGLYLLQPRSSVADLTAPELSAAVDDVFDAAVNTTPGAAPDTAPDRAFQGSSVR